MCCHLCGLMVLAQRYNAPATPWDKYRTRGALLIAAVAILVSAIRCTVLYFRGDEFDSVKPVLARWAGLAFVLGLLLLFVLRDD